MDEEFEQIWSHTCHNFTRAFFFVFFLQSKNTYLFSKITVGSRGIKCGSPSGPDGVHFRGAGLTIAELLTFVFFYVMSPYPPPFNSYASYVRDQECFTK